MSINTTGILTTIANLIDKAAFAWVLIFFEKLIWWSNWILLFYLFVIAILDLIIWFWLAVKNREVSSKKLKKWIITLTGNNIIILVCVFIELSMAHLTGWTIPIPLTTVVCGRFILSYAISIMENMVLIWVNLPLGLIKYLKEYQKKISLPFNKSKWQEKVKSKK